MIAEILLVLAGHPSSLLPDHGVNPALLPLLHPGEQDCLEALGRIASRYRKIKKISASLSQSPSRYICALCVTLNTILKDEYENLVVDTEARILQRDSELVAQGSFVPLSAIRAIFAEWDGPLTVLEGLLDQLESQERWQPGPLIDMLIARAQTGIYRIASIFSRLSTAVQRVWRTHLIGFLVHGSLTAVDPLASDNYVLLEGSVPSCVSSESRESIAYVGRAISTIKARKGQKQLPREQDAEHMALLESVLPDGRHEFDRVIFQIRTNVSEWLWLNVLTLTHVEDAVVTLGDYFLLRNGEFSLALIREIERLKLSRLTARSSASALIREQDLNLALLRASLGTTAQHDESLLRLRFHLPSGPLRPLLPSLASENLQALGSSFSRNSLEASIFDDLLLGTSLHLSYSISWPLDLFLHPADLQVYAALFNYLSSLRKTHTRLHTCWTSLSNAQRARRRWTGLGEGGTTEDLETRKQLLRCSWGVVRDMGWFLDTLLGYVMVDVIEVEFQRLKDLLNYPRKVTTEDGNQAQGNIPDPPVEGSESLQPNGDTKAPSYLDFSSLRIIHTTYLERLLTGCLLYNAALTSTIRSILEICERFVAHVERWGGDVLPALLFEGSLTVGGSDGVGALVRERQTMVTEINTTLHTLLDSFYNQLSLSTSLQPFTATADASKSVLMGSSLTKTSTLHRTASRSIRGVDATDEVRRHVERLLLRLDFNGGFSKPKAIVASTARF